MADIRYSSFIWNFGTTSFRTKQMNYSIERQLELLEEFWDSEEGPREWKEAVQTEYYNFIKAAGLTTGNEPNRAKAAREKTSGLVDIGLVTSSRHLTDPGRGILSIAKSGDYRRDNLFEIPKDSMVYLCQMLKYSLSFEGESVRPLCVIISMLNRLDYLTYDEFTYLVPLCINHSITEKICKSIPKIRKKEQSIEDLIVEVMLARQNYKAASKLWMESPVSKDLIMKIGMNRKSPKYDADYCLVYEALKKVFLLKETAEIPNLYKAVGKIKLKGHWRKLLFDTSNLAAIKKTPAECLNQTEFLQIKTEDELKKIFFKYLHLFKAKQTLEDYFDLNRRYLKLTNVLLFEDKCVSLDLIPKIVFKEADSAIRRLAYARPDNLDKLTSLAEISKQFKVKEKKIFNRLSSEIGKSVSTATEVREAIEKKRYERFNKLIDEKFSDEILVSLLDKFDNRDDSGIAEIVTDNADTPTIFEYVLGVVWYKASGKEGKVLDYMKLSLDADLLPVTHAAGGEADIVYEYPQKAGVYPLHTLLIEATLADSTSQRRMEMEPVSRHLGNLLLRSKNASDYCVFVSPHLDPNVISDFKGRKNTPYIDTADYNRMVDGMKIIPLDTMDVREIIKGGIPYERLYGIFEEAYTKGDLYKNPVDWRLNEVKAPIESAQN